jgi:hypothetical protein
MSYSPQLLQAQITLPSGGGEVGLADPTRLENPFQAPMWLDEVRVRLPTNPGGQQTYGYWGSSIYLKLLLGSLPLTSGNVPIGLFGKNLNYRAQFPATTGGQTVFTWKLPKPLFIPAREFLRPIVYYAPTFPLSGHAQVDQVVTICYAVRPLPKGTPTPRTLQLPWATAFVPPFLQAGVSDDVQVSTPSDIYNPWNEDLHVQRFLGQLLVQEHLDEFSYMTLASENVDSVSGITTTGTLVTAQDSFNNILVRDPTPFAHLFNFNDFAWTVNAVLPPKGFYTFTLERLWSAYTGTTVSASPALSMIGWRNVPYAQRELPTQVPMAPSRPNLPKLDPRLYPNNKF